MKIINLLIEKFKKLDIKLKNALHIGLIFSFILCIFSSIILFTYQFVYEIPDLYYIGISLFKSSLIFGCTFIMCAISFDTIKNELT